jgi:hypothetical protein
VSLVHSAIVLKAMSMMMKGASAVMSEKVINSTFAHDFEMYVALFYFQLIKEKDNVTKIRQSVTPMHLAYLRMADLSAFVTTGLGEVVVNVHFEVFHLYILAQHLFYLNYLNCSDYCSSHAECSPYGECAYEEDSTRYSCRCRDGKSKNICKKKNHFLVFF